MTEPDPAFIQSLFDGLEKIPANAISEEDNMGGNVICSRCWGTWLTDGTNWRSQAVEVVTVYNGMALCESHFKMEMKATSGDQDD